MRQIVKMMNKKLTMTMFGLLFLLAIGLVSAHEHNFAETKQLIDSGVSCDNLSDEQLEDMGNYYMEQMHPGEAHKMMDEMMGGEDSESLKQMHIQMAKMLYCNEDIGGMMNGGMMNMMMGNNMMGSGDMGMMGGQNIQSNNMMQGKMGNGSYKFGYWSLLNVLYTVLLIGAIILVYTWTIKSWKTMKIEGRRR